MASGKDSAGSKPGIPFIKNYFVNGKSYVTWLNELCQKWTLNHNVAKFDYIEATPGIVGSNRFVSECTIFHELKPISGEFLLPTSVLRTPSFLTSFNF